MLLSSDETFHVIVFITDAGYLYIYIYSMYIRVLGVVTIIKAVIYVPGVALFCNLDPEIKL